MSIDIDESDSLVNSIPSPACPGCGMVKNEWLLQLLIWFYLSVRQSSLNIVGNGFLFRVTAQDICGGELIPGEGPDPDDWKLASRD